MRGKKKKEAELAAFQPQSGAYRILMWLIFRLFPPIFRRFYGYRVIGEIPHEKMKEGCITVCNHVHTLDCVMLAHAFGEYRMQYLTLASNCEIPVAGAIVRCMGGIPLPDRLGGWKPVFGRIEKAFSDGQILQIYPEGERISGCRTLRAFRPGAFTIAAKYRKPVIPCVLRFYPRYKKNGTPKRDGMELVILPPVLPEEGLKGKALAQDFSEKARTAMEEAIAYVD